MIVAILLVLLAVVATPFAVTLVRTALRGQWTPSTESIVVGAVTNFFDTLGIGSFAPTTAWIKLRKLMPDSFIPAALIVGHCLPAFVGALIFINLVQVDPFLLAACIASAVAGATVGVPIVVRLPVRVVQAVVGVALLIASAVYAATNLGLMPPGGNALTLAAPAFALVVVLHFILGALMTFGIGLYAPSLITLSLLGLNPVAAFPIMMGSCAFLMPVAGLRFLRTDRIDMRFVLGLALGGFPAVLIAAFIVKSLPLETIRWGVVVVVLYAATLLLLSAARPAPAGRSESKTHAA